MRSVLCGRGVAARTKESYPTGVDICAFWEDMRYVPRIPLFLWVISPALFGRDWFFRPHGFRMQICAMEVIFISRNKSKILALTVSSAMVALSVVFTRFIGYSPEGTPLRFELGFLPIAVAAYAFGPIYSALGYLTADVIGSFYSGYAPNIWITLCQFLSGIILGLMLHKKRTLGTYQKTKLKNMCN